MIIETKNSGLELLIDDNSIFAIQKHEKGTMAFIFGGSSPVSLNIDFEEMKEIFIEAKKRDRFTGEMPVKPVIKKFPVIEIGEYKFSIQTVKSEHAGEVYQSLTIIANFPVKNDLIKTSVEFINGVESYNQYGFNKYEGNISVGKLFDIEIVREQVEQKIKECIE